MTSPPPIPRRRGLALHWWILIAMGFWRRTAGFFQHAYTANVAMMCAGFMLIGYQLTGLFVS